MDSDRTVSETGQQRLSALERLCRQLLYRWDDFPSPELASLRELLADALAKACEAQPEIMTVVNPVSRPVRLQLYAIASDSELDSLYHREWAELAVSHSGVCYLIYRRKDGGDYAVEWSSATSVPAGLSATLPPELALAMFEQDGG
jgi:hypothetical protein